MTKNVVIVLLLIGLSTIVFASDREADIIWRDYNGTMPKDALIAGSDARGDIYMGITLFQNMIIPGKLYKYDKHIYFEFGEKGRKKSKQIKILCTKYPENFEWIFTKHTDYRSIKNEPLVIGGYQPGFRTYIGKVVENREANVGKIVCREHMCYALYVWYKGGYREYHSYYVLKYKETTPFVEY